MIERGTPQDREAIVNSVRGQILELSRHKFASNVVDKVILCANEEQKRALVDEVLSQPSAVEIMLKDQFSNYAVQKLLLVVVGPQREILVGCVADALLSIRKFGGGQYPKHLLAIEKYIQNEQAIAQYTAQMQAVTGNDPASQDHRTASAYGSRP